MAGILTLHYKVLAILEVDSMNKQPINRTVGRIVVVLSFAALLAVLSGYAQPPQRDEGTAAHLFQVSIVGLVPMLAVFLMTADWKQPWRSLDRWHFQALLWSWRLERSITWNTTERETSKMLVS